MSSNWTAPQKAAIDALLGMGQNPTEVARSVGVRRESVRQYSKVLAASSRENARTPVQKPRYRVPYVKGNEACVSKPANDETQEALRVCVIGDLHVSPGQDLSRIRWIARHIKETKPDHIVQIGDWASFDSVSQHDPIGSIKSNRRPSLRQDMECLHESLAVFDRELGPSTTPRLITLGNHEQRVARYEQLRSELEDSLWTEVLQSFAQFRWKTFEYGEVAFIGGCGFVHTPMNRIGKPHSSPNIMVNNLSHDLIKGHSHVATYLTAPKIGNGTGVTLIDVGTSLPHGHVEPYAKLSQTSWWWGLHDVIIRNGRIDDFARISMKSLEARYA
jgi:hypothetical protein